MQSVMDFIGTNREFLEWFNDSVKLFHELTSSMNKDERRRLTKDPGE